MSYDTSGDATTYSAAGSLALEFKTQHPRRLRRRVAALDDLGGFLERLLDRHRHDCRGGTPPKHRDDAEQRGRERDEERGVVGLQDVLRDRAGRAR